MRSTEYILVYQYGIANVFQYTEKHHSVSRVVQNTYAYCEAFCAGLLAAGLPVEVRHCDMAGDIKTFAWPVGRGEMFSDKRHPPLGAAWAAS